MTYFPVVIQQFDDVAGDWSLKFQLQPKKAIILEGIKPTRQQIQEALQDAESPFNSREFLAICEIAAEVAERQ